MLNIDQQQKGLPTVAAVEQAEGKTPASSSTTLPGQVTASPQTSTSGWVKPQKYGLDNWRYETTAAYRAWHRTTGANNYAFDSDLIEFRCKRGEDGRYEGPILPVCMTETTAVEKPEQVDSDEYLSIILYRLSTQAAALERLALMAGIQFFILIYDRNLTRFAVHEPRTGKTLRQSKAEHAAWLRSLEVK